MPVHEEDFTLRDPLRSLATPSGGLILSAFLEEEEVGVLQAFGGPAVAVAGAPLDLFRTENTNVFIPSPDGILTCFRFEAVRG